MMLKHVDLPLVVGFSIYNLYYVISYRMWATFKTQNTPQTSFFFPKKVSSCTNIHFSEHLGLICYFELVIISRLFWAHFRTVRGSYDGLSILIHVGVANTLLYNTSQIHSTVTCLNSGLFSVCKVMALFQCITYPQNQPEMFFSSKMTSKESLTYLLSFLI